MFFFFFRFNCIFIFRRINLHKYLMSIQIVKRQGVSGQDCCCNCKSEIVDFTTLDANGAPRIIHERTKERKEDNLEKECKEEVCLIFG